MAYLEEPEGYTRFMIHIFYGPDSYSRSRALEALRNELQAEGADLLRYDATTPIDELIAALQTLPFLAPKRLVIVQGLLTRAESGRRGAKRRSADASSKSAPFWAPLAEAAAGLPPTTVFVLVDGALDGGGNALLKALSPFAERREFRPLRQTDVPGWIIARAREVKLTIASDAIRLLAQLCGSNLWAAAAEIEKLRLYVGDRQATAEDVRALAADVREESVFQMVDAIVEGRPREALRLLTELRANGEAVPYLLTMIARQYRLLILARELAAGGLGGAELGRRIGVVNEYALRKIAQQSARADMLWLESALARLLDADVAMKRGVLTEDLAIELVVAELAGTL